MYHPRSDEDQKHSHDYRAKVVSPRYSTPRTEKLSNRHTMLIPQKPFVMPSALRSQIRKDILVLHNRYRSHHSAPALISSDRLNQMAQNHAEVLAAQSILMSSSNTFDGEKVGENILTLWITAGTPKVDASSIMKKWYEGVKVYNYSKPKFSVETGTFTQIVWKSSKKLGVGAAFSPNGKQAYIVANYSPSGNVVGSSQFEQNVLRSK